jgi:hypothetical protein
MKAKFLVFKILLMFVLQLVQSKTTLYDNSTNCNPLNAFTVGPVQQVTIYNYNSYIFGF